MSNFTPTLFIGVGATGAMFTLRETYQHHISGAGDFGNAVVNGVYQGTTVVRSFHHCNLANTADAAFEKAQEYAKQLGLKLITTREGLAEELREIHRSSAEQIEARRLRMEEEERLNAEKEEQRKREFLSECCEKLNEGIFPFGRFAGTKLAELPRDYAYWILGAEFEKDTPMFLVQDCLRSLDLFPALPVADPISIVGQPKQRLTFNATVVKAIRFERESWNGDYEYCYVTTMVDDNKNCIVVFSPSFSPEIGDQLSFKATVKEHKSYNGQAQTVVQRLKVL